MTEFKGILGNYKILKTEDNTQTIYSEYFDEACHNLSGAYEETLHNYILGCAIPDLLDQGNAFAVLDVGFGVGVGLLALLDEVKKANQKTQITYYSIELDEGLLLWSLENTLPKIEFKKITKDDLNYYEAILSDQFVIRIFLGDGRLTLPLALSKNLIKPVAAIFQDAFSPNKNPTLWSVEWFDFLREISTKEVILTTYSSSISIRKSLIAAGWSIESARGFALKKFMTKAKLHGLTSEELLLQLSRSPTLEIRDK